MVKQAMIKDVSEYANNLVKSNNTELGVVDIKCDSSNYGMTITEFGGNLTVHTNKNSFKSDKLPKVNAVKISVGHELAHHINKFKLLGWSKPITMQEVTHANGSIIKPLNSVLTKSLMCCYVECACDCWGYARLVEEYGRDIELDETLLFEIMSGRLRGKTTVGQDLVGLYQGYLLPKHRLIVMRDFANKEVWMIESIATYFFEGLNEKGIHISGKVKQSMRRKSKELLEKKFLEVHNYLKGGDNKLKEEFVL